jgi:hypothetical protein
MKLELGLCLKYRTSPPAPLLIKERGENLFICDEIRIGIMSKGRKNRSFII